MSKTPISHYLKLYPQNEDESVVGYRDRIYNLMVADGQSPLRSSIRTMHNRYRSKWSKVSETKDGNGNVKFSTHKVISSGKADVTGMAPTKVSRNPYGEDWVTFKPLGYVPPTVDKELIQSCLSGIELCTPTKQDKSKNKKSLLRCIYTDVHIGMETDKTGFGLYGGVWNEEELFKRKDRIVEEVLKFYGSEKEIHLIDLGDFMDGWDGQTVRKGHDLPQNMDNVKAFKVGVKFKIELAGEIQSRTGAKVKCYNVGNDNHCADFGIIVNETAKLVLEQMNPNIKFIINRKFIEHYTWENHCFILSHGKDSKNLKFGFKHQIDDKAKAKIEDYIRINKLMYKDNTFEKGDTHLQLFDYDCSEVFNYFNYRALSPASEWVQTNFKRGVSGFTIMKAWKDRKELMTIPIEFGWS